MNTQTITKEDVAFVINSIPKGAFFSVEFVKKDKTVRKMNARMGVKSHLTPNPIRSKAIMPSNMITVFDVQNAGYRHINTETTRKIVAEHRTYLVV